MRELKYRAWHKEQMFEVTALQWSASNPSKFSKIEMISIDENHAITTVTSYDCDGCIIRQYTGLKDSKGQEVYEGDIIRAETYLDSKGKQRVEIIPVEYHDSILSPFHDIVLENEYWIDAFRDQLEVIGNVYEHKHLLPEDDGK